ncbi:MAG: hypothetical protein M1454_03110 [Candidatus Thermoplasmatota archaeon]|nr:hypothetical protein [Candidatus Thermoplasmatota archaeon]MCL5731676.1 hypothetical protein [Candidatus Thermoplasmatota archaeon]
MPTKICDVVDCSNESFQTVPMDKASKVFSFKSEKTKVHLCREHYKEYKKKTKKERDIDRLDWIR